MRDLGRETCLEDEQEQYTFDAYEDIDNGRKAFKYCTFEEVDLASLRFIALSELQG